MSSTYLEEHTLWCTLATKKVQSIYNRLSELESLFCEEQEDVPKLFELLELINEIQEHHTTVIKSVESSEESLSKNRNNMEIQMAILEKSIDLLKLEMNCN